MRVSKGQVQSKQCTQRVCQTLGSDQKEGQRKTKAEGSGDKMLWCQHNRKGLRKLWRCYGGVELLLWNGGVGFLCWGAGVLGSIMVGWSCGGGM